MTIQDKIKAAAEKYHNEQTDMAMLNGRHCDDLHAAFLTGANAAREILQGEVGALTEECLHIRRLLKDSEADLQIAVECIEKIKSFSNPEDNGCIIAKEYLDRIEGEE